MFFLLFLCFLFWQIDTCLAKTYHQDGSKISKAAVLGHPQRYVGPVPYLCLPLTSYRKIIRTFVAILHNFLIISMIILGDDFNTTDHKNILEISIKLPLCRLSCRSMCPQFIWSYSIHFQSLLQAESSSAQSCQCKESRDSGTLYSGLVYR